MPLVINSLQSGYGNIRILPNLTTTIPEGKITALIGPNGCGKSTLLKTIARLLPPQGGEIRMDGDSIYQLSAKQFARRLSLFNGA